MEKLQQESPDFERIVDKLRDMDEGEMKLAYLKLFKKEIEDEWAKLTAEANFEEVTDEEIVVAVQKKRYGPK